MPARIILITGASSGIGAALACAHADPANHLVLWGRNRQRLEATARSCSERAGAVEHDAFDISDIDLFGERLAALDGRAPVDIAIFNAGIGGSLSRETLTQSPATTREMIGVNLMAPVVGANLLGEAMARRGNGHLVFVGSIASNFPLPMAPAYAATKAGLALFAEALRIRLTPHGVYVTLVEPGFVDTPMSRSLNEPRPFLISAEKAAAIIANAIERRSRRVVLPWQFALVRGAAALLPRALVRALLARA